MAQRLLTTIEAADLIGCSRRTVQRLVANGVLVPAVKGWGKTGRHYFARADVAAFARRAGGKPVAS